MHWPKTTFLTNGGGGEKVEADGRMFQERWEGKYMFVLQGQKTVCLLCYEAVSVNKGYNLRQHFDIEHAKVSLSGQTKNEEEGNCQRVKVFFTLASLKQCLLKVCEQQNASLMTTVRARCSTDRLRTTPKTRQWHTGHGKTVAGIRPENA